MDTLPQDKHYNLCIFTGVCFIIQLIMKFRDTLIHSRKPENKPNRSSFVFLLYFWLLGIFIAYLSGWQGWSKEDVRLLYVFFCGAMYILVVYFGFIRREIPIVVILNRFDTFRGKEAVALGIGYLVFTSILFFVFWP